jgi:hypothetical protein
MPRYRIITLVDITRTNVFNSDLDKVKTNQQANFDSLRQAIELRSNVYWNQDPTALEGALPEPFEGRAAYWTWEFETEREDLFLKDGDPVALLKEDLHGVPIISGLNETVDLYPPAFKTRGDDSNTDVRII